MKTRVVILAAAVVAIACIAAATYVVLSDDDASDASSDVSGMITKTTQSATDITSGKVVSVELMESNYSVAVVDDDARIIDILLKEGNKTYSAEATVKRINSDRYVATLDKMDSGYIAGYEDGKWYLVPFHSYDPSKITGPIENKNNILSYDHDADVFSLLSDVMINTFNMICYGAIDIDVDDLNQGDVDMQYVMFDIRGPTNCRYLDYITDDDGRYYDYAVITKDDIVRSNESSIVEDAPSDSTVIIKTSLAISGSMVDCYECISYYEGVVQDKVYFDSDMSLILKTVMIEGEFTTETIADSIVYR